MSYVPANFRKTRDSREMLYNVMRGDDVLHEKVLHPTTVREILNRLSAFAGDLAFTPEVIHRAEELLERNYDSDLGNDLFMPPNYAPYDDPKLASFYGILDIQTDNIQTRKETFDEIRERLISQVVRELEPELPGLTKVMNLFATEAWPRHGVADEAPLFHTDPDITLFRNPGRGWAAIDNPIATSTKTNVVQMYDSQPEFVFPRTHPAWEVDRHGGFYDQLDSPE
jgi:hypothetical protein